MKNIALMIFLLAVTHVFAQSEYNWQWDWEFDKSQYQPIQYSPTTQVNKITFTRTSKKGKVKMYQKLYNENGNLTSYSEVLDEQHIQPIIEYKYDENDLITQSKSYKKGKLKYTIEKKRLEKGKPTEVKKTNSKGKVVTLSTWEYNSSNCVVNSTRYKNEKLYRTWEYEYHSDCDKSKSVIKNKSGKVLKIWTYECKEEGQQLEKRKKETQVCKWDESTKDYLIKVNQSFDEKGRVYKTVSKYTLSDTLIVEYLKYNSNDELVVKRTYDKDYRKPLVQESYKKGEVRYTTIYTYENGNLVSNTQSFKGKYRHKSTYKYEENRLVERKFYNKKNEVVNSVKLAYS